MPKCILSRQCYSRTRDSKDLFSYTILTIQHLSSRAYIANPIGNTTKTSILTEDISYC